MNSQIDAFKIAQEYVGLLQVEQEGFRFEDGGVNNRQHSLIVDIYYEDKFVGHVFVDYWYGIVNPYLTTSLFTLEESCREIYLSD